jgi:hypothetical protein
VFTRKLGLRLALSACAALAAGLALSIQQASPAAQATPLTGGAQAPALAAGPAQAAGLVARAKVKIVVSGGRVSLVKLECVGSARCRGEVTLAWRASRSQSLAPGQTTTIGSASFSIPARTTRLVRLDIDARGRALLRVARGHLVALLTLAQPPLER